MYKEIKNTKYVHNNNQTKTTFNRIAERVSVSVSMYEPNAFYKTVYDAETCQQRNT